MLEQIETWRMIFWEVKLAIILLNIRETAPGHHFLFKTFIVGRYLIDFYQATRLKNALQLSNMYIAMKGFETVKVSTRAKTENCSVAFQN